MTRHLDLPADCTRFIGELKARLAAARLSAARAVNRELIALYWDIGEAIVQKQKSLGWGQSVVEQIARDLRAAFPGTLGFWARNVWDMRRLYEAYSQPEILRQLVAETARPPTVRTRRPVAAAPNTKDGEFLRQLVAEIPWGHHLLILSKLPNRRSASSIFAPPLRMDGAAMSC